MANLIAKTTRYFRRNGLKKTVFAVAQNLTLKTPKEYFYVPLTEEELLFMKKNPPETDALISILVPAYKTDPVYFRELLDCVTGQIYPNWELVIADASPDDSLLSIVQEYREKIEDESKIRYLDLPENLGISNNTNVALDAATGSYIGLLDHDDLLTPDALYWVARELAKSKPNLIYSDEDKTDKDAKTFYEPNRKKKLNLDLILTNNYICHFTVMEAGLMKRLRFREEYDGAQDYDIILRCIAASPGKEDVVHIPKILYHWRCHENSTAQNTDSKMYAYENGRRAIEDFLVRKGCKATVSHMSHLGFYRVEYEPDLFQNRPEIGIVGGPLFSHGKISGGAMSKEGRIYYAGMPKGFSGYMHRASLTMKVGACDVRNMKVRPELEALWKRDVEPYLESGSTDFIKLSLSFCEKARAKGYGIVYDPEQKK